MDADRWATLQTLLAEALDLDPDERAVFLEQQRDPEMAAELAALLDAADAVPAFLDGPPAWDAHAVLDAADGPPDLAGTVVGPYRLVRELGRGGQGRVFLAHRDDVGTQVALKLVHGTLTAPEVVKRFLTERRVLAGLVHPHIARLLDAGAVRLGGPSETPYLVMEAVEGLPLTEYVEKGQPSLAERLRLFLQVCDAVSFAHRRLVVHRDLKPSNILVEDGSDGPHVKLLDFGIAKLLSDETDGLTRTGQSLLTPEYSAPEQVLGEDITVATDVYALGVILYEVLAGERPYDTSGGLREALRAVCDEEPVRPSARAGDPERARALRGDLDAIVLRSLAKAPGDRYATVEALAADLRRYRDGLPVRARPPTLGYRASRFVRRHAMGVAVAGLAVALVGAFGWREVTLRNAAEVARDDAQATADFVLGIFDGHTDSRGSEERVDTLRTLELLDRAAEQLGDDARPSRMQALFHLQLGRLFEGQGYTTRAQRQFAAAAASADLEDPEQAEALYHLGTALHALGDCAAAVEAYDSALDLHQTSLDKERGRIIVVGARSSALACTGAYGQAVADAREVQAYHARQPDDNGVSLHVLADVLNQAGREAEAYDAMVASIEVADRTQPAGHPIPVARRLYLARLLDDWGREVESVPFAREAYRDALARNGPLHDRTLDAQQRLAASLIALNEMAEAESLVAGLERVLPQLPAEDFRPRFSASLLRAQLASRTDDLGTAERAAREALYHVDAIPVREGGAQFREQFREQALGVLADVLDQQGDRDGAIRLRRQGERTPEAVL
ncbi:MAG: protein kinase [Bacteroidota bacterium]